jgi:plasmid stabilization system protein ParE
MAGHYRLRPAAVEDMEAVIDYLNERNPLAAVRFVESAQATFEHLAFMPDAYPSYPYLHQRLQGVRCRPLTGAFHRYVVFYRVEENADVDVLRVLHAAQDLDRILGGG